jgi:dihydrofolate reductase
LDGVVEAPEAWALPFWDDENRNEAHAQLAEFDAFLLGRVTYEKFAASWANIKGVEYYDAVNKLPKFVASTTLRETAWNASVLRGDIVDEVAKLKRQPGKNLLKYGSGNLDRTLIAHELIDEFRLWIFPVKVGSGARLFEGVDTAHLNLKLVGTKTHSNGIVLLTYVTH